MSRKYIILQLLLLFSLSCFSQNKESIKHNDSIVGYENLPYNNGVVYTNKYPITSKNTNQFLENKYSKGLLQFNNQSYYDVNLKYDIYNDILLFKPKTQLFLEISLITKQVDYFILNNKKFKKIETISTDSILTSGYYEELDINEKSKLYIKYKKTIKTDPSSDKVSYIFYDYKIYYVYFNNKLEIISNKNSIINLFPAFKKEIKKYYKNNEYLKDSNLQLFYQNLFKTII